MNDASPGSPGSPDVREAMNHSAAHALAEAVARLHPGARFHNGPASPDGFHYDVELPGGRPVTTDDLPLLEAEIRRVADRDSPIVRRVLDRDEALELFASLGQPYKIERIHRIPADADITAYDQQGFLDLCRGPHVSRTGLLRHVKLTHVSGAYLDGDQSKTQLQRVHGVAFGSAQELDAWQLQQAEAARRDHRRLGQELGLFMTSDLSPGAIFWLPRGEAIYHTLQTAMRALLEREGYVVVNTPMVLSHRLWEKSGHLQHYHDNMFHVLSGDEVRSGSPPTRGLKPMNCPCHMEIFGNQRRSYRELPLRIHDQGVLHRNELSGVLGGLTRVRQFAQDDAHIFAELSQIRAEVLALIGLVGRVYAALGLGYSAKLSTRPAERLGEEALWDAAEEALLGALAEAELPYALNEGDGAFYGPKIDFDVKDAIGRSFQCATIQLDFQLPRRFGLRYTGPDGGEHTPVVIHRAIFGSFERFVGILIEHFAGAFPVWLAPEAARVATISERSGPYARAVHAALADAGVRAALDDGGDKIARKVRAWRDARVPYLVVVGEQEAVTGTVALRSREGDDEKLPLEGLVARLRHESRVPFLTTPALPASVRATT